MASTTPQRKQPKLCAASSRKAQYSATEELARLDREAERADQQAERWEQAANRIEAQRARHLDENDESTAMLRQAGDEAARARAEVTAPLAEQAERDGAAYLSAVENEAAETCSSRHRGEVRQAQSQ